MGRQHDPRGPTLRGLAVALAVAAPVTVLILYARARLTWVVLVARGLLALAVAADCTEVKLTLKHTGKLPAAAMGHNWVLVKTADRQNASAAAKDHLARLKRA